MSMRTRALAATAALALSAFATAAQAGEARAFKFGSQQTCYHSGNAMCRAQMMKKANARLEKVRQSETVTACDDEDKDKDEVVAERESAATHAGSL